MLQACSFFLSLRQRHPYHLAGNLKLCIVGILKISFVSLRDVVFLPFRCLNVDYVLIPNNVSLTHLFFLIRNESAPLSIYSVSSKEEYYCIIMYLMLIIVHLCNVLFVQLD